MPRPKGSKNRNPRKKKEIKTLAQILAAKEETAQKIEALSAEVTEAAAALKAKKAALKQAQKDLAALEKSEAIAHEAEAKEQRKADADKLAEALAKSGKSLDEVLEMLQK